MTALTADRNTARRDGAEYAYPVAASVKLYAGSLACLDANGFVTPGATSTTLKAVGRADNQVDNSAGADGDQSITVTPGIFLYANSSGGDEIARADVGSPCYIVDDQTVAKTDGGSTRSQAGVVVDLDDLGVWVRIGL